jgi:integrase
MGAREITDFLSALAVKDKVAASTQNQALSALLFLYRAVLAQDVPWLDDLVRAKRPERLPVVLTRDEVRAVLDQLHGVPLLMVLLLYGAGLRLLECARLRIKDVDFVSNQIVVRDGKGFKDRVTMLPASVKAGLAQHLDRVRRQHQFDLERGAGWVELPYALKRNGIRGRQKPRHRIQLGRAETRPLASSGDRTGGPESRCHRDARVSRLARGEAGDRHDSRRHCGRG